MTAQTQLVRNVVITRSKKGNAELAAKLRRRGLKPMPVDTISLLPPKDWPAVDAQLKRLGSFDWLVFTSSTGVRYFGRRMEKLSLAVPWAGRPAVAAVGAATARAISGLGLKTAFTPSGYLTERLADELPPGPGLKAILFRADIAEREMAERMRARGFEVTEVPIYRTRFTTGGADGLEGADAIVFASASSVEGFCRKVTAGALRKVVGKPAACIGPVTARAAREHGFVHVIVPETQTFDSLLDLIAGWNSDA